LLILVIEAQIPTEEDLMEADNVQFPSPAGDDNAMRFNDMTPVIEIPTEIIIQRIGIEGHICTCIFIVLCRAVNKYIYS